jgi:hypothetical protein
MSESRRLKSADIRRKLLRKQALSELGEPCDLITAAGVAKGEFLSEIRRESVTRMQLLRNPLKTVAYHIL